MKLTWIGQAGFQICTGNKATIMIDPYLSNSLRERRDDKRFEREVPIDESYLCTPDVLILTHLHDDHTDFGTLDVLFSEKRMYVLAPGQVVEALQAKYGPKAAEYIYFAPGTEVTLFGTLFCSMPAVHSTREAIGVAISSEGKTIWHTGDTLYHKSLITEGFSPDLLILPINGVGNNMNAEDAARLTKKIKPKAVLPMHWDMFRAFGTDPSAFLNLMEPSGIPVIMPKVYEAFIL